MIKLKDILILEDIPDDVFQHFQNIPFGEDPHIARFTTGHAISQEDNTEFENELLDILQQWTEDPDNEISAKLYKNYPLLKKAVKYFPSVLKPDTNNGTSLYRGIKQTNLLQTIENLSLPDFEKTSIDGNDIYIYKEPIKYTPHRDVQSWSSSVEVALRFAGQVLLMTTQNDEFLFSQELISYIYQEEDEAEVLHFGKEYSNNVYLCVGVDIVEKLRGDMIKKFGKELPKTKSELEVRLKEMMVKDYSINTDLSVDLNENFSIVDAPMEILPFKINKIDGQFKVSGTHINSLENFPKKIDGDFTLLNNFELHSLEGFPQEIKGEVNLYFNGLRSLKGMPQTLPNVTDFDCSHNQLTSLEHGTSVFGKRLNYICSNNNLRSLKGVPKEIMGTFICSNNKLTSLEGGPEKVDYSYQCHNNKLTSLKGAPESIEYHFDCSNNNLTSLREGPKYVGGNYYCHGNNISKEEEAWAKANIKIDGTFVF
jgi:Leucine-rich repeat (LRR) protein